jgi:hypothetical protein
MTMTTGPLHGGDRARPGHRVPGAGSRLPRGTDLPRLFAQAGDPVAVLVLDLDPSLL